MISNEKKPLDDIMSRKSMHVDGNVLYFGTSRPKILLCDPALVVLVDSHELSHGTHLRLALMDVTFEFQLTVVLPDLLAPPIIIHINGF